MERKLGKKICFAASTGGHYEQLMMLEPLMEEYDSFIITEKTRYKINTKGTKCYTVPQVNRNEKTMAIKLSLTMLKQIYIYLKERPDVVICTGVLSMIPMCLICKIMGKKLIYIESFAKTTDGTKSGMLLYRYADIFYVQWETMLEVYPKAKYLGGIY